jgi:hypothetical protein
MSICVSIRACVRVCKRGEKVRVQKAANSRQQAADTRQQAADTRHQTAGSRQQAADSRQQTPDTRQRTDSRQTADRTFVQCSS